MKQYKKDILKSWWNENLDYLPLGAKWRGKWQKRQVKRMIKEIDERSLDIEVAQKVFGYKVEVKEKTQYEEDGSQTNYPELQMLVKIHKGGSWNGTNWAEFDILPNYSTDIKDAWNLVEKINEAGFLFSIEVDEEYRQNQTTIERSHWNGEFIEKIGPFYFTEKTASTAICAAALKAHEFFR